MKKIKPPTKEEAQVLALYRTLRPKGRKIARALMADWARAGLRKRSPLPQKLPRSK